jgi:hypothetical protein
MEDLENKKTNLQSSVETLCDALKTDPSLYISYQANIAMAFKDEYSRMIQKVGVNAVDKYIHEIANPSAKNFLDLLIKK